MHHNESKSRMFRVIAWLVLSTLVAVLTLSAPLALEGEPFAEDTIGFSGADTDAAAPDVAPPTPRPSTLEDNTVVGVSTSNNHELPKLVQRRSLLLRYAPKLSPPHPA